MSKYLILIALLGVSGWAIKHSFEMEAERDMAIESFTIYSKNAQQEAIEANKALAKLGAGFQAARDIEATEMEVFARHDLPKLLEEKPRLIVPRINRAYHRLFNSIEATTRRPATISTAAAP